MVIPNTLCHGYGNLIMGFYITILAKGNDLTNPLVYTFPQPIILDRYEVAVTRLSVDIAPDSILLLLSSIIKPQLGNVPSSTMLCLPVDEKNFALNYNPATPQYLQTVNTNYLSELRIEIVNQNAERVKFADDTQLVLILNFKRNI